MTTSEALLGTDRAQFKVQVKWKSDSTPFGIDMQVAHDRETPKQTASPCQESSGEANRKEGRKWIAAAMDLYLKRSREFLQSP
uniref:Uncharacterized protein n=1 Tax=Candidatus Kentrum sp. UNK TaxID=2126344 RepID=A0A451AKJ8_9GAMM|nr:MAG: hypothetical protein BECKUNK1418G_GA0071005_109616 [Candidatus Kentron sp. UNK]VFK71875.1 MAG: hypothetical protein BECKUNK1418H_GA0071006_108516 [Candidatus Kentron sp. UNK]